MKRVESKVRFEPEFYKRLQRTMIDRDRKSLQGLIEECLERWIEEGDSAHGKAPWTSATVRAAGDTSAQNTATLVPSSNKEKVPPTKDPVGSLTQTLDQYGTNPYAELTVIARDLMAASDSLRATASRVNGIIDKGGSTDFVGANINDAGHVVSGEKTTEQIIAESYRKLDEFERSDEQVGGEGEPRKGGDRQATGRGSKGKRGAA